MGVNISELIPKREIELSYLNGKIIAVDAFNALYQFLTSIRQADGTPLMDEDGNISSHISGLIYRNLRLLSEGIKLVYVFDGIPPEQKLQEIERRKKVKEIAEIKYQEAVKDKNIDSMRKYASRSVTINEKIISETKELLNAMGIPYLLAPSEGEAEAASLAKKRLVWGTASQDYDTLLYGAPFLVRNLTMSKRRKIKNGFVDIKPEVVEFNEVLRVLDIDRDQLICLAILVGTDYNPGGIKGLGQKRALEIVQKYKYPFEIFRHIKSKYEFIFDWQEIFRLFHEYETSVNVIISFPKMNIEKIEEILLKKNFGQERIRNIVEKLEKIKKEISQKSLEDFF